MAHFFIISTSPHENSSKASMQEIGKLRDDGKKMAERGRGVSSRSKDISLMIISDLMYNCDRSSSIYNYIYIYAIASYTYKLISKHCWHHFVAHPQICSPQRRKTCRRQVQLTSVLLSWRWTRTTKNLTLFLGLYDDDDRYINYNLIKISS